MKNSQPTIIFDFDGTVADTTQIVVQAFNKFAQENNLPKVEEENLQDIRNLSAMELMKKYNVSGLKLLKMAKTIRDELGKKISESPIISGIKKLFSDLKKKDYKVGIVTSNTKENVKGFLSRNKITEVDFVHGEKNIFGKGKVLKKLIKNLKLNKDEVWYVGDEVRDIEAAREAGIKVISVTWGFNSEKRLIEAKPDIIISQPREIFDRIISNE